MTDEYKKQFEEADTCWICKGKFAIDKEEVKCLEIRKDFINGKIKKIEKKLDNNKAIVRKLIEEIEVLKEKNDKDKVKSLESKKEIINKEIKNESDKRKSLVTSLLKIVKEIEVLETRDDKVWDHCHITGKFREAAHNTCNLQLQIEPWKTYIPVVFHNFRRYDSHLVCESVRRSVNAHQIKVIAETFERYKSMKVDQLKYIDSMQFMNTSLANLTKNLGANHPITSQNFKDFSPEQISLVFRKGIYPYEYIDSHNRFKETELPPIHKFYRQLSGKITEADYQHAQKVWKEFGCKNLGEYYDLYLKTDVLSLIDIFIKFQETFMKYYKLDPAHYVLVL